MRRMWLIAYFWLASTFARASLGDPVASVTTDRDQLHGGEITLSDAPHFKVYQFKIRSGVIREFATPSGIICGISWSGRLHPDLRRLLNTRWAQLKKESTKASHHRGQRRHRTKSTHLVVERWGHMRRMQGRAYDPTLLPSGTEPHEIN